MQKTRIAHEVAIDAPKQNVWEVLSDFGNVYRTSPNIIKSYLTSDQKQGVGTTRHCDFTSMGAPILNSPETWVTPMGRMLFPLSRMAVTAPLSMVILPTELRLKAIQHFLLLSRRVPGMK